MKKTSLFLLFFVFGLNHAVFSKMSIPMELRKFWQFEKDPDLEKAALYSLLGNWYDPIENKWTYGFFENFAIHDGRFWEYRELTHLRKGLKLEMIDDRGSIVTLTVEKTNDSTLRLTSAQDSPTLLRKANQHLPHYTTPDHSHFKDTEFKTVDTAYVVGYLRHAPSTDPFEISVDNMLQSGSVDHWGDVDSLGRFMVKIPLMNTAQVFMDWRRSHEIAVLQPGETYFFFKDFNTGQTLFMGDNERFLNEIVRYQPSSPFGNDAEEYKRMNALKGMDFLKEKQKQLAKANAFTGQYLQQMPSPSQKLRYFASNFNKFYIAFDLMQKRFDLNRTNNERFPEAYMQYVTDSLYLNNITPISLIRNNSTFLTDYVQYSDTAEKSVPFSEMFYEMVLDGTTKVSQEQLEIVKSIVEMKEQNVPMDKAVIDSLESSLGALINLHQEAISERSTEKLRVERDIIFHDGLLKSALKDIYNARTMLSYIESTSSPIPAIRFTKYLTHIESPLLKQQVSDFNQKFDKIAGTDFKYLENIKNTAHLAEATDADKILAEILAPHKGKVVYLDFWGTWCEPCRIEMKHVPAAKEALKGKDVVFIYLANRSSEKSWENFIKDNNIEGENVIHYRLPGEQQAMVERRLGITAFPTYMLVNKQGEFSNVQAPRPSQKDQLVKTVESLLE